MKWNKLGSAAAIRRLSGRTGVVLTLLFLSLPVLPGRAQAVGGWETTGSMTVSHGNTQVALLTDGRVLAISGPGATGGLTPVTDLYDPATGTWTQTGQVNQPRNFVGPVVLHDGTVLITGGTNADASQDYGSTEVYDPATGAWSYRGSLNTSRRNPVVIGLTDGRVLVADGAHGPPDCARYQSSAEIYDPATGQWTFTGSTSVPREAPSAVLLHDGRVMLFGGFTGCDFFTPVVDLYNPATGTWSRATDMPFGRLGSAFAVLADGRVLVVGGGTNAGPVIDAMLYDPATNQWTMTTPPPFDTQGSSAILLSDGRILVAGGGASTQALIYDPVTATWTADAMMNQFHSTARLVQLGNGKILIAGGYAGAPTTGAELYSDHPIVNGPTVSAVATNSRSASGNNTITATATTGVPAGQTVTVAVATGTFAGTVGCTDAKGNSYAVVADKNTGNGRLFVCSAAVTTTLSPGDAITATYPGFSGVSVISVNAFADLATGSTDLSAVNSGNSPNPTSGPVTTTHANEVIFGVIAHNSTPTITPGAGFTVVGAASGGSGSGKRTLTPEYQIVSTTGTYAATATLSAGQQWRAAIVTYTY